MIKKLTLTRFGMFADRVFDFSRVTVFLGKNEKGKTTIFDAILDNLCDVGGNSEPARMLKNRYGAKSGKKAERISSLEFDHETLEFSVEEFLSLYAVKSGVMTISMDGKSDWVSKIQAALFTGGIDPKSIKEMLEKEASEKGSLAHMIQMRRKTGERAEKEALLKTAREERRSILTSQEELEKRSKELQQLRSSIGSREADLKRISDVVATHERVQKKVELYEILKKLAKRKELSERLVTLAEYQEDRSGEAKEYNDAIAKSLEEVVSLKAKAKTLRDECLRREGEALVQKSQLESQARIAYPLKGLLEHIDRDCPRSVIRQTTVWNRALIAVSAVLAVTGIGGAAALGFSKVGLAILAAGIIASAVIAFLARSTAETEESADAGAFLKKVVRQWRDLSGDASFDAATVGELKGSLIRFEESYRQRNESYNHLEKQIEDTRKNINAIAGELEEKEAIKSRREDALRQWLRSLNVESLEKYMKMLNDCSTTKQKLDLIDEDLQKPLTEYSCDDKEALKVKAEAMAAALEKETAGVLPIPETELAGIRQQAAAIGTEIESLRRDERQMAKTIDHGAGHIAGSLGSIPERIRELEEEVGTLDEEIHTLDLNRRAAGFAAAIFDEIARDSSIQFDILSKDLAGHFSEFLPGVDSIRMYSFNDDDILVADGGKEYRQPANLSTGTRDAFWLAARLSLARKANPGGEGIIVLDEPFHAFDDERVLRAVALLKRHYDDTGWQVVLFTKDRKVSDEMKNAFREIVVHEL